MKAYLAIFKTKFQLYLQYRAAAFAGLFTQFFFGLVKVMVFIAFFASTKNLNIPMSLAETISYTWIAQGFVRLIPWDGDKEVLMQIRDGSIAYELLRPMNLYNQWFAKAIALRSAPPILRAVPLYAILIFVPAPYGLNLPVSLEAFFGFLFTSLGAVLISAGLTNIINIISLWTISGEGIARLIPSFVIIFSGLSVPLVFFPEQYRMLIKLLPFSGLIDIPVRVYLGKIVGMDIFYAFLFQVAWTIILIGIGKYLIRNRINKLIVQGG